MLKLDRVLFLTKKTRKVGNARIGLFWNIYLLLNGAGNNSLFCCFGGGFSKYNSGMLFLFFLKE